MASVDPSYRQALLIHLIQHISLGTGDPVKQGKHGVLGHQPLRADQAGAHQGAIDPLAVSVEVEVAGGLAQALQKLLF